MPKYIFKTYMLFYEFVSYNLLYINIWTIYGAKDIVFAERLMVEFTFVGLIYM